MVILKGKTKDNIKLSLFILPKEYSVKLKTWIVEFMLSYFQNTEDKIYKLIELYNLQFYSGMKICIIIFIISFDLSFLKILNWP